MQALPALLGVLCILGSRAEGAAVRASATGVCSRVNIVRRAQWGAAPPKSVVALKTPVKFLLIHHTETPSCTSLTQCSSRVKNIQNYHQNTRGWADIGYQFLVGGDGRAYEGRGWSAQGAHAGTSYYNKNSVAIAFIGNFGSSAPSATQMQAAKDLINCAETQNVLTSDYKVKGHRDVRSTSCPGQTLYNIIKTWPRYG